MASPATDDSSRQEQARLDFAALRHDSRLSIPFPLRLPLAVTLGSLGGALLGLTHGANESGFRFRAENAHRFPTTQTGWYLYHKSKNYHMMLGGVREGFKMAWKQGIWVGVYVGTEEFVDRGRAGAGRLLREVRRGRIEDGAQEMGVGGRDFVSSVLAGVGTAGAFSAWYRFPMPTAVRMIKLGAKVGLAFGLVQDVMALVRGRRLGYVDFIKRHTIGTRGDQAERQGAVASAG